MTDDAKICRICLDAESVDSSPLVQPCRCSGTQAYVHLSCLARWQKTRDTDTRRNICPVCRHVYAAEFLDSPPISPSRGALPDEHTGGGLLGLMGARPSGWLLVCACLAVALLFVCLPFSAALVMATALGVALTGVQRLLEAALRVVGVRLCFVVDDHGAPLLRVVRIGSQIEGLAAGALCAAAPTAARSLRFARLTRVRARASPPRAPGSSPRGASAAASSSAAWW